MPGRGRYGALLLAMALLGLALAGAMQAALAALVATDKISDVRGTRHNLSAAADGSATRDGGKVPARNVKAISEDQVCVFCHTPHGATTTVAGPLWDRKLSSATYIPYSSSSMEANATELANAPGGSSKLCLSCHDGTMAIDTVNVLDGVRDANISMTVTGDATVASPARMPAGSGATTGFTRRIGTDLSNDHPISFTYDSTLATDDGELRTPVAEDTAGGVVMNRVPGKAKPRMPLENNQVQCATCHDPHIRDKNATSNGSAKFLRMNRFQLAQPQGGAFDTGNDIICLACHDKGGKSWAYSAHASKDVATQAYANVNATTAREIPVGTAVWQVGCLNCHDTHTVQGARRLLREGISSSVTNGLQDGVATTDKADFSKSAIEQTCYACHASDATLITPLTKVPNIKSDFGMSYRMPINASDQGTYSNVTKLVTPASKEAHDIGSAGRGSGRDFVEDPLNLGYGDLNNRHAECTDCHNPHRVIKARTGLPGALDNTAAKSHDVAGTHLHDGSNLVHSNVISGVLRGTWGVEPDYTGAGASFNSDTLPAFTVKRGDPGSGTASDAGQGYVTREYQICLKCHSNYGYADGKAYPNDSGRPQITAALGRTTPADVSNLGHSNFTSYTNQAKEFQAPTGHKGELTTTDSGAGSGYTSNNHRSWHPVMGPTGRTPSIRGGLSASNWNPPWSNDDAAGVSAVGQQTMYCSDCHGSKVAAAGTVRPDGNGTSAAPTEDGSPWGPHGSNNPFLLKGTWNTSTGAGQTSDGLCFKCHKSSVYVTTSGTRTGFWIDKSSSQGGDQDGHKVHNSKSGTSGKIRCNWCHVAVPHGWKNKALLVNLNDVGPEGGKSTPGAIADADIKGKGYSNGPYYRNAMLKVKSFAVSGKWTIDNCGATGMDSRSWMKDNTCNNPP